MRRLALAAVLVTMCGCSNGGSSDLDLGTPQPTQPATVLTAEATTSTTTPPDPPTTTTTTAPPIPTDPPTTEAASTSTSAPISKEDQVRADYEAAKSARDACAYDPFGCDYGAIAVPGSPMDVRTHDVMAERIRLNLRAVP